MNIATFPPRSISEATLSDHAAALSESLNRLKTAAANATELLRLAGLSCAAGDTADDLRTALAIHGHRVHEFNVTVRTSTGATTFCTCATNAAGAAEVALAHKGDTPCGITVTPTEPDRQALVSAHRTLRIEKPLDAALEDPTLGRALRSYARKHPVRPQPATDFKSLAANDRD